MVRQRFHRTSLSSLCALFLQRNDLEIFVATACEHARAGALRDQQGYRKTTMDLTDRSRIMGMTSSVTCMMSSPKVVLMILCCLRSLLDVRSDWLSLRFKISRHWHCSVAMQRDRATHVPDESHVRKPKNVRNRSLIRRSLAPDGCDEDPLGLPDRHVSKCRTDRVACVSSRFKEWSRLYCGSPGRR